MPNTQFGLQRRPIRPNYRLANFSSSIKEKMSADEINKCTEPIKKPADISKTRITGWRKRNWVTSDVPSATATALQVATSKFIPCHKLLAILCKTPVTTAEAEHSFSTLCRIKTWLRDTQTHHQQVDIDTLINFANKKMYGV